MNGIQATEEAIADRRAKRAGMALALAAELDRFEPAAAAALEAAWLGGELATARRLAFGLLVQEPAALVALIAEDRETATNVASVALAMPALERVLSAMGLVLRNARERATFFVETREDAAEIFGELQPGWKSLPPLESTQ